MLGRRAAQAAHRILERFARRGRADFSSAGRRYLRGREAGHRRTRVEALVRGQRAARERACVLQQRHRVQRQEL